MTLKSSEYQLDQMFLYQNIFVIIQVKETKKILLRVSFSLKKPLSLLTWILNRKGNLLSEI